MSTVHRRSRRLVALAAALAAGVATSILPAGPAGATGATGAPAAPAATCDGSWRVAGAPSPGEERDLLLDVATIAPDDAWAVGYNVNTAAETEPFAVHWNGTQWRRARVPGGTEAVLTGVHMVATDDVWAVGYVAVGLTETRPYAIHWNGDAWRRVDVPNLRFGVLTSVHATGAGDVWAVGMVRDAEPSMLVLHSTGGAFERVPAPSVTTAFVALDGVVAVAQNNAWAVGYAVDAQGRNRPLSIHWDGFEWTRVRVPDLGTEGSALEDVTVTDTGQVWAVGWRTSEAGTSPIALRRFDGVWSQPATVFGEASRFTAVAPLPGGRLVAVGFAGGFGEEPHGISEVYDGSAWHVVPTADVPGADQVYGVATVPGRSAAWAVGDRRVHDAPRSLIERRCG